MKKLLAIVTIFISLVSTTAYANDKKGCEQFQIWQYTYTSIYKVYAEGLVNPKKYYILKEYIPKCEDEIWVIEEWSKDEINKSLEYWENAENEFCVVRDDDDVYSGKASDLFFKVDGEYIQSTRMSSFRDKLGKKVRLFINQENKLYALEYMDLLQMGVTYPTCL